MRWGGAALPALVFCLLRVPTLIEPHWYTDEAGYAVTAWLSMHGHTLYGTVWNNKPPLLYWTYGLLIAAFGPGEAPIHAASAVSGLVVVLVVHRILRGRAGAGRAALGGLLAAVLLGTPILNGDLALPENLLVGPAALGILLLLHADGHGPRHPLRWTAGAGACFAAAVLYQQTAIDVIAAATLWLLVRRGWSAWPRCVALLGTVVGLAAGALLPYAIWVGPSRLVSLLVTSYGGYTTSSLPPTLANLGLRAAEALLLVAGAWLARRLEGWRLLVWMWAAATLVVATLPNRPYPHFALPAVAPLAILVASLPVPRASVWRKASAAVRAGGVLLAAATLIPIAIGWSLLSPSGVLYSMPITGVYYQAFIGRLDGTLGPSAYGAIFNPEVDPEAAAAAWLRAHHLAGSTAVVWSADAWVDLLTPLRPQLLTPTLYMNEYWLGTAGVLARVRADRPRVIVTDQTGLADWPDVEPLLRRDYRRAFVAAPVAVWVRGA